MPDVPPYLIVPEIGANVSHAELTAGLPDSKKIRIILPKDMPPALGAPVGGDVAIGLIKATEWVLALDIKALFELSAFLYSTAMFKEMTKQLAGEAGKDAWKGIKLLVGRIREFSRSKPDASESSSLPLVIRFEDAERPTRVSAKLLTTGSDVQVDANLDVLHSKLLAAVSEWLEEMHRPDLFTDPGWVEGEAGQHILRLERETREWQRQHGKSEPIAIRQRAALRAGIDLMQSTDQPHIWLVSVSAWPDSDLEITVDTNCNSFTFGRRKVRVGFLARLFFSQLQNRGFHNSTAAEHI